MIGVDTNVLIYAHRAECAEHKIALGILKGLTEGKALWALTWATLYEFIRVVTHPRVFSPPTATSECLSVVQALAESPSLRILGEGPDHLSIMLETLKQADARGNLAFDAHIAALFKEHGVKEIISNDGDFHRFKSLKVNNPFR